MSARLIGGGPTLKDESLLSSPDRLGGGGEGGSEDEYEDDFLESNKGVLDLLGILKCPGEELLDEAEKGPSVDKYAEVFANERFKFFILGGDWGGWTVTAGGAVDIGRGGIKRVGEGDNFRPPFARGGRSVTSAASVSRPLVG